MTPEKIDHVMNIRKALVNLTREEQRELDSLITPRLAELLVKAFGPDMRQLLGPLLADETSGYAQ